MNGAISTHVMITSAMAGDQCRSVVVQCVEVASVAISGREELKQAEQREVGYILPATELLSLPIEIFEHKKMIS